MKLIDNDDEVYGISSIIFLSMLESNRKHITSLKICSCLMFCFPNEVNKSKGPIKTKKEKKNYRIDEVRFLKLRN